METQTDDMRDDEMMVRLEYLLGEALTVAEKTSDPAEMERQAARASALAEAIKIVDAGASGLSGALDAGDSPFSTEEVEQAREKAREYMERNH